MKRFRKILSTALAVAMMLTAVVIPSAAETELEALTMPESLAAPTEATNAVEPEPTTTPAKTADTTVEPEPTTTPTKTADTTVEPEPTTTPTKTADTTVEPEPTTTPAKTADTTVEPEPTATPAKTVDTTVEPEPTTTPTGAVAGRRASSGAQMSAYEFLYYWKDYINYRSIYLSKGSSWEYDGQSVVPTEDNLIAHLETTQGPMDFTLSGFVDGDAEIKVTYGDDDREVSEIKDVGTYIITAKFTVDYGEYEEKEECELSCTVEVKPAWTTKSKSLRLNKGASWYYDAWAVVPTKNNLSVYVEDSREWKLSDVVQGDAEISIYYTANAKDPSVTSSSAVSQIKDAGTYTITASFTSIWNTQDTLSCTIEVKCLDVTYEFYEDEFCTFSKTYGQGAPLLSNGFNHEATVAFLPQGANYSGQIQGEINGVRLTREEGEDVGFYDLYIDPETVSPNIKATWTNSRNRQFEIKKLNVTYTLKSDYNYGKTYGEAEPDWTKAYDYDLGGWTVSEAVLSEVQSARLVRDAGENAGEYAIALNVSKNVKATFSNLSDVKFVVGKLNVTYTLKSDYNYGKTYGEAEPDWTKAYDYDLGGKAVSEAVLSEVQSARLVRDAGENAGEYAIALNASNVSENVKVTFSNLSNVKFVISKLNVTYTLKSDYSYGKTYGEAEPDWTKAYDYDLGGKTVSEAVLSEVQSARLVRDAGENAGKYAIALNASNVSENVKVTFSNLSDVKFVIGKLNVTYNLKSDYNYGKTYGEAEPDWTKAYDYDLGGKTVSEAVLSEIEELSLGRSEGENAGEYTIFYVIGTNSNFDITFSNPNDARFVIDKLNVTYTLKDGYSYGKTYGKAEPDWTKAYNYDVGGKVVGEAAQMEIQQVRLSRAAGEKVANYDIMLDADSVSDNLNASFSNPDDTKFVIKATKKKAAAKTQKSSVAVVVSAPIMQGQSRIYGFAEVGSEVIVVVNGERYSSKDGDGLLKIDSDGCFYMELPTPLAAGDQVSVKYADGAGNETKACDFTVSDTFSGKTIAQPMGKNIVDCYENGDGKRESAHRFVTPIDLDEMREAAKNGSETSFEVPMLAFGGYQVGTMTFAYADDQLVVTPNVDESFLYEGAQARMTVYDALPDIEKLVMDVHQVTEFEAVDLSDASGTIYVYVEFDVEMDWESMKDGVDFVFFADDGAIRDRQIEEMYRKFQEQ